MIMGAGKTTVIAPLLAVILADGSSLVMQIMPDALLVMSHGVMKSIFSTLLGKKVFTFKFVRGETCSTAAKAEALYQKFELARGEQAIVCTTPGAVKSLMLLFVDNLLQIKHADNALQLPVKLLGHNRDKGIAVAAQVNATAAVCGSLRAILKMWRGGVALIDEVDWVLQPLAT